MRRWWWLMVLAGLAQADDGGLWAEGGSPQLMSEHPSVRMVSEVVTLHVPSGWVEARFVFRNDGPARTVTMGFPEDSTGVDQRKSEPTFGRFRSWVDGRRLRRSWWATDTEPGDYSGFWLAKVHFAAGQTRIVEDSYRDGGGSVSTGDAFLDYTLRSGASWKGTIGDGLIRVIFDDSNGWCYRTRPASRQTGRNTMEWRFHDLDPRDDFSVIWKPRFTSFWVDRAGPRNVLSPTDCDLLSAAKGDLPARKSSERVIMSLREAASELGLSLDAWDKSNRQYIELHNATTLLQMREGGDRVLVNGRLSHLREPLRTQNGWLRVCLQDLVDALDGTWHWNADPWGLVIDLPRQAESAKG